jgi:uncharacterized protein with PhoU and TrkA domain
VTYYNDFNSLPLKHNDRLLLKGKETDLELLKKEKDFSISPAEQLKDYQLEDHLLMAKVPQGSPLVERTLLDSRLGDAFGLSIQGIIREDQTELMPSPDEVLRAGDTLIIKADLLEPIRRGIAHMFGQVFVGDNLVSEGELMAQIVKEYE